LYELSFQLLQDNMTFNSSKKLWSSIKFTTTTIHWWTTPCVMRALVYLYMLCRNRI